jgi:hypothetical protein
LLLDDGSTDRTVERARRFPGVVVSPLENGDRQAACQRLVAGCAGRFDYVALVEADEFLVPKAGGTLPEAIARLGWPAALGGDGYAMVRGPGEDPYEPGVPLPNQRRWGVGYGPSAKAVVLRASGPAQPPGHQALQSPQPPESPLYLLHYAAFDESIFLRRRLHRAARHGEAYLARTNGSEEAAVRRQWQELQDDPRRVLLGFPPLAPPSKAEA